MTEERNGYSGHYSHKAPLYDQCKNYMFHHVTATTSDGNTFDGIIEGVDQDRVSMLVGEDVMEQEGDSGFNERQFYGGYGFPRQRFRRFRRQFFPLAALTALSLFPYYYPYPYYPYPYPYYPYY
ncbi:hypothetical protein DS031_03880 [Bacillus taeanensis]|uniref:Uncharacterized protein n=2 Tax=Bacillus taeanensis TaxID=273032 RepID=A0A366Y460_9BACI|nr:hypothetical protein DS031_03880 [Bacillus taeanensis]